MRNISLQKPPNTTLIKITSILTFIGAASAFAETKRQLASHEHGVSLLNIAFEGTTVHMELYAPGADIVGFEHLAQNLADKEKINAALATLSNPLEIFVLKEAAGCTVIASRVGPESDGDHEKNLADQAAEEGHEDHGNDAQHNHEDHFEDGDDHREFTADYLLNCQNPEELSQINFAYFAAFPNAQKIRVQVVRASGATTFDVSRALPVLDIGS